MTTFKSNFLSLSAGLIAVVVALSGAHAKDLAGGGISGKDDGSLVKASLKTGADVTAKALADLHTHVDKTALKVFAKSAADTIVPERRREIRMGSAWLSLATSMRLLEMMIAFKLAFGRVFAA